MIYPSTFEKKTGFDAVRRVVADACLSAMGREEADAMSFSPDYDSVAMKLRQTAEMLSLTTGDSEFQLGAIHDMRAAVKGIRVQGSFMPAQELMQLRAVLDTVSGLHAFFSSRRNDAGVSSLPALDVVAERLVPLPEAARSIDRLLDRWGNVRDNASPELADIRRSLASMNGVIAGAMRRVMARAVQEGWVEPDVTPAVRDGRLVVPVAPANKRRIAGIVHDESASGKTVFIEPAEIVEANNRLRELQMRERREVTRLLVAMADSLRPSCADMLENLRLLGEIDFIHAKAVYALAIGATMPALAENPEMEWYHACHPVLKAALERQGKAIVPLDIALSAPERRMLVISGPNAGGKSVTLKTVGIIQYMAQCGLLPPVYENSRMGVFESIFIDIGDDQSIEDDLSTYSSHLRNMKHFLARGNSRTLILVDEFGAGTEPQIGGAIAQAILSRFNEQGMWGVVTTHFQNLKHFAEDTDGLVNGSMLYDRQLMQPQFRLLIGHPGSSFAVEIARKTGLPEAIIADAEAIVGSDYVNMDKYLLDITRDKRYWENKRADIRRKEKKLEETLARYEADADNLRSQRREIIADARAEARRILDGSNAAIERTIHDIRRAQADREATLEARRRLDEERRRMASEPCAADADHPLTARVPKRRRKPEAPAAAPAVQAPLAAGDNVLLDGAGTPGTIESVKGGSATVIFGQLRTTVKLSRLTRTLRKAASGAKAASFVSTATSNEIRDRQLHFRPEMDVRGMRADEAVQAVTYFVDDALQFNAQRVRILHGTGTGALRQYIRQYLATVHGVRAFRDEDVRLGGAGITVVELN